MESLEKIVAFINSYPTYAKVLIAVSAISLVGTILFLPRKTGATGTDATATVSPATASPSFSAAMANLLSGPQLKAAAILDKEGFVNYFKDRTFRDSTPKLWFDFVVSSQKFDIAVSFENIPNAPDYLFLIDIFDPKQASTASLNARWAAIQTVLNDAAARTLISDRFGSKKYTNPHVTYAQIVGARQQLSQDLIQDIRSINQQSAQTSGDWYISRRAYTVELLSQGLRL